MKILYQVNDPSTTPQYQRKFVVESDWVPRIGDRLVRHVDAESTLVNRFRVSDVTWIIETREWYLNNCDMWHDVHVSLVVEEV